MGLISRIVNYAQYSIYDYSILVLFMSVPFYRTFSSIAIVLVSVISFIEIFKKRSLPKIQMDWFLPALFLYYAGSLALSGGTWSSFEKMLLLLAMPLLFALNIESHKEQLRTKVYLSFIIGNLIVLAYCFVIAIKKSITISNDHWSFNPKIIGGTGHDFLTSSVMGGNYFFGEDFSLFLHPTYFGLYIVFAQYLIFEIYRSSPERRYKRLLVSCYFLFFIFLFMLSSKAAIISSLLLTLCLILVIRVSIFIKLGIFTLAIIFSGLFVFFNPRMRVFKDTFITGLSINPQARFGHDLRILSWDASMEIIKNRWLLGVGEANKTTALVEVYTAKGYVVPAQEMFNSHNQYLDFLIGGGIFGFGLFITGLIMLLVRSIRQANYALLAFLLIFSFAALFENLLARHAGILFFSIFISLLTGKSHSLNYSVRGKLIAK